MSSNLVYHTRPTQKDLSHEVKQIFQILYGCPINTILTESHVNQLKAIAATYKVLNRKGDRTERELQSLIDAINKYTEVYLKEDFR